MTTFTIHAEPALAEAVRRAASGADLSINKFILRMLRSALGLSRTAKKEELPSFLNVPRTLTDEEADRLLAAQEDFNRIDEDEWK